eukprot:scaffold92181_cov56-Phaeocystis_antarctica.AAC.1
MPHMRGGPDTWHVSQTRRRVESIVFYPRLSHVSQPSDASTSTPDTSHKHARRTCKIDTSPSPEEACWLLFSTCTILRIRHAWASWGGRAHLLHEALVNSTRGARGPPLFPSEGGSRGARRPRRNFAANLQGIAIEASAPINVRLHSCFWFKDQARSLMCGTLSAPPSACAHRARWTPTRPPRTPSTTRAHVTTTAMLRCCSAQVQRNGRERCCQKICPR